MSVGSIQMAVKFVMLSGNTKAAMVTTGAPPLQVLSPQ